MVMQFKEHEQGRKTSDPRMVKLDKLARLLNVSIFVDGIAYGKIVDVEEVVTIPEEEIAQIHNTPTLEPVVEKPKTRKSPTRSKKVVDKSSET